MAFQSSGTKLYSSFITIYGGVSTIIFTTTITASDLSYLEGIATISWPTPATTGLVEYTSDTVPTDPASKYFPHPLPIFIATEVDGVVVNTVGQPIATIIEVQAQPAYMYSAPTAIGTETDCNGDYYICWSEGKKAGVILAVILGGLLFLLFILWFCCFMRIPRSRQSNEEQDHGMTMRHQDQDPDRGGGRRRKHERNSDPDRTGRQGRKRIKRRHSSLSSGSFTEPPKPLPRVVTAQDYREIRRIASVPQNVLGSETSSGLTGRRAVLGVGVRDARRDGILFETAKDRNTAAARNTATTFTAATAPNAAPQARPDLDTPQREIRRDSRHVANVDQQQRGRSPGRNRSTRYRSPRKRSYSPYHRSDSPPTDNRSSFAPYIPVAVAALEHLWERLEEASIHNVQRQSQDISCSSEPKARSQRRSLREDRRATRQHYDRSSFDQPRSSRPIEQGITMSGGRGDSPSVSPPPIPRKSSRRRLSNYI